MNEQEQLQQAFIQYLAQISGAKTQEELQAFIQQLGEEGIKQAYQQFLQQLQQQQQSAQIARKGAKLNFIRQISRVMCNPDETLVYYKVGGKVCKKCQKLKQQAGAIPYTPIQEAKGGTKVVREFKQEIYSKKCGGKAKGQDGLKIASNPPRPTSEKDLAASAKTPKMCKGKELINKLNRKGK